MYRYNHYLFIVSLLGIGLSYWNRNNFDEPMQLESALLSEPMQKKSDQPPFTVQVSGVDYLIEPLYEYELSGLVVSFRHHDGGSLHEQWNDHLNVTDLCVVWGKSAGSRYLNQFSFWNGQFTCEFKTRSNVAWHSFDPHQLSNNHLLSDDDRLRAQLESVKVGDQVRIRGLLARYSNANGFSRSSSTTRLDSGNGACETIYVTGFEQFASMKNGWQLLLPVCWVLLLIAIVIHFRSPYRFE